MFVRNLMLKVTYLSAFLFSMQVSAITLEEATYQAIENSPTVRQALAKYREDIQNAEQADRTGFYPSIDLDAGIGRQTSYADNTRNSDISLTRRETALTLTQPIFDGFSTTYDVKRLSSEAQSDRWQALIKVEDTALKVSKAYTDVLRYRELLKLADQNLATHKRIYKQIKLKTDSGIGRESDLSQITARLAKARANRSAALNNLSDAETNYLKVVGKLPPKNLIYPIPDRTLLPKTLQQAISQSLKQNPAIIGSKWDVDATESYIKSVNGANYPSINFTLERKWNNNIDGTPGPDADLQAMIRLKYNLYNGGSNQRKKEAAVQQNVQASEIRRNTIRETEQTVRLAWSSFQSTKEQKGYLREYVIATKQSQVAYAKQFRLGRRTLLDVLDSENELFQARQDYVNTDYDELYSEFRLFNAKGELLKAFRIYRPDVLGFSDNFKKDQKERTGATPIQQLQQAEKTATQTKAGLTSTTQSDNNTQVDDQNTSSTPKKKSSDDSLFIDSGGESDAWQ
ncbi:Outer membrane efflux protein BepC precursor [Marinomonas spartinae]|uniref:Outer membrane efflux protein BepC n=1 Tax=Marinomonas spartinae TaxID=1792290 RepID=A0A1A8T162_9GAMM|nr:TolC family outer membrane protein [Marinomonas spartinae]SBS24578.1 Outer membrane efflux protein BepC precursor [Marinomonas spartinae]SBS25618.1 Outer membrane efflux protein BepC precursor [Marinomonas spartinae]